MSPLDPGPARFVFDVGTAPDGDDLVGVGADLEPATLVAAYRSGVFPMGLGRHGRGPIGWWSPDPRGVLPLGDLHVSRSTARSARGMQIRVDSAFADVVAGCADPGRPGRWITPAMQQAYLRLYRLGWAHSVETWRDGVLVGGLYGVAVGGLFAAESKFHRATDASKVAVAALVALLREGEQPGERLLDVQWRTPHLARLGVVDVPRTAYLAGLRRALRLPLPPAFARCPSGAHAGDD